MIYDTIVIERAGGVAILKLNRPPVNAFNYEALDNLGKAIDEISADNAVRAVIITGTGKAFSAGFDVKSFGQPVTASLPRLGHIVYNKIDGLMKPVIAAINGVALGGGCELALACHLRFMSGADNVFMGLTEIKLGLMPGWGGTQRLSRIIGRTRALEMALTGTKVGARQALEWGLINRICEAVDLYKDAVQFADMLSLSAPLAVKGILQSMRIGMDTNMATGSEIELMHFENVSKSKDALEGITAFTEKREPNFTGE